MAEPLFDYNIYRDLIGRISTLEHDDNSKNVVFTFKGSKKKVMAHRNILQAASPVFNSMFSGNFAENDVVKVIDIEPKIFQLLLR